MSERKRKCEKKIEQLERDKEALIHDAKNCYSRALTSELVKLMREIRDELHRIRSAVVSNDDYSV